MGGSRRNAKDVIDVVDFPFFSSPPLLRSFIIRLAKVGRYILFYIRANKKIEFPFFSFFFCSRYAPKKKYGVCSAWQKNQIFTLHIVRRPQGRQ
jgi:hypothetical protein